MGFREDLGLLLKTKFEKLLPNVNFDVKGNQFVVAATISKDFEECSCQRFEEHISMVCMNPACVNHESQAFYCSSCLEDKHVHEVKYLHRYLRDVKQNWESHANAVDEVI
jgi:hypothetical protein